MCIAAFKQVRVYHLLNHSCMLVVFQMHVEMWCAKEQCTCLHVHTMLLVIVQYSPLFTQPFQHVHHASSRESCLVCRLCMVCLSPNHPVMEEDIVGVDFFHDCKINLSGKMKNKLLQ